MIEAIPSESTTTAGGVDQARRIFATRLETLRHLLDRGHEHFGNDTFLDKRLAADMQPLGTQVPFACNLPRAFAFWCSGKDVENLPTEVTSLEVAYAHIEDARRLVESIDCPDARLDEVKRVALGPGLYCELVGHRYLSDFLIPNLYFHITTLYAILRTLGVPLGKADYMTFLLPEVRRVDRSGEG